MATSTMAYLGLRAPSLIKQKQLQLGQRPALITLVLYTDQAPWTAPTDVKQCFAPSLPGPASNSASNPALRMAPGSIKGKGLDS
ncbi:MAG: hypothetical protein JZU58_01985 [Curvibacter lanceolatus]|uniref:hypothetical protein n=1 Tax=Curvibacter lanceolatus TaxID=86182 RepID=UPI002353A60D|nr:hypothetical protein [Curvibacter lanceolatus]MBV5291090.1 hypothetical protein [Curvibacter lanceolatus]